MLLVVSALLHTAILGGFAFRMAPVHGTVQTRAMDVALVAPPTFIRPPVIKGAKPPPQTRVVVLDAPPRYAPQEAVTGDAGDATDLFGPVFDDGLWPRPVLVERELCVLKGELAAREACRNELLLIGLAADPAPRTTTP